MVEAMEAMGEEEEAMEAMGEEVEAMEAMGEMEAIEVAIRRRLWTKLLALKGT